MSAEAFSETHREANVGSQTESISFVAFGGTMSFETMHIQAPQQTW